VPLDNSNLAYRAAQLIVEEFPKIFANYGGVDIFIDKQIPVAAGLAGGSTDGAAVLVGMNLMWELGLTVPDLQNLGARLGSDVPFCVSGGTAIATGRGEKLDSLFNLDDLWVVLAKYRSLSVSTAWAYKTYKEQFGSSYIFDKEGVRSRSAQVHSGPLVKAILNRETASIGKLIHNDLEKVVLPAFGQVARLREAFQQVECVGAMMSGSGPTVFALCESKEQAEMVTVKVREMIPDPDLAFWITRMSSAGIEVDAFN
jgi:4-diphosphocytidyl-2-C-methyl-D-erythritol kinase